MLCDTINTGSKAMTVICEHIGERNCLERFTRLFSEGKINSKHPARDWYMQQPERRYRDERRNPTNRAMSLFLFKHGLTLSMFECAQGLFWFSYFLVILVDSSSLGSLALPEWTPTLSRSDSFFVVFLMFIGMSQAWALNECTRSKIVVYFWASLSSLSSESHPHI